MTKTPEFAYAHTSHQLIRPPTASQATPAQLTVRYRGVVYVLSSPSGDPDPSGLLVKRGE